MPSSRSAVSIAKRSLVEVAVPVGVDRTFVYAVPPELAARIGPGSRVEVAIRGRVLAGVVVGEAEQAPRGSAVHSIRALLDQEPALPPELLTFTRWLADYYAAPWGEVLRAALPAAVAPRKRDRPVPGGPPGMAEPAAEPLAAAPAAEHAPAGASSPTLTPEQSAAVAQIEARIAAGAFRTLLLHGVTASGKTEVYLRAALAALRAGGEALVLVPEIGLSVQLLDRFQARLGPRVAILHSSLTSAERRREWERVRAGQAPVVVGARSAIFAPLARLKLVVVDEEHEAAYKQDEVPRYHARDAAVMRGRIAGGLVILGSATPSLESAHNAARGRYDLVRLTSRVDGRLLPEVILADRRRPLEPALESGSPSTAPPPEKRTGRRTPAAPPTLSPLLHEALGETLARGEQAILLVHRRGHSSFVQCTDCGAVARCPHCAVALTYHSEGFHLRCHYCNLRRPAPEACADCAGSAFWYGGIGTQRVASEIAREFPAARLLRMDLDSTRSRGSHRALIERFAARDADILIGTQMVAKGLDFPGVSLVGVVSADTLLNLPDFRAGERAFQLLTQVAGRAGRGPSPGRVIIQTHLPEHPSVVAAAAHDYDAFYAAEIAARGELGYPPLGAMARVHVDGPDETEVSRTADALKEALGGAGGLIVLGPAPLPLHRLRGRERWHLTLLGASRARVHAEAKRITRRVRAAGIPRRVRLHLDLDPVHLM